MPDDCGELMEKYLAKLVNKARQEQCNNVYKRYNNICDYCGGVAQKYNCVNCGAPKKTYNTYSYASPSESKVFPTSLF